MSLLMAFFLVSGTFHFLNQITAKPPLTEEQKDSIARSRCDMDTY